MKVNSTTLFHPLVLAAFFAAGTAFGAADGSVNGLLSDPQGKPVSGASVTAQSPGAGIPEVHSDSDGRFSFPSLPPAEYTLVGSAGICRCAPDNRRYKRRRLVGESAICRSNVPYAASAIGNRRRRVRRGDCRGHRAGSKREWRCTNNDQSDASGSFGISGLPAGDYRLVVSNPAFGTKEVPVTITPPSLRPRCASLWPSAP